MTDDLDQSGPVLCGGSLSHISGAMKVAGHHCRRDAAAKRHE